MLKTLILKEIKNNLGSFKFSIVSLLSVLLILTSFFIMTRDYQTRVETHEILKPEPNDPTALVAPTPLSILAKGLDDNLCRSYQVRFGGQIEVGSKQQAVNAIFQFFSTPDLLFMIKVVMALAALLFAFDAVAGEKEAGTLKLSLANACPRPLWVLGKWLGGFISFIVPLLVAFLLGLLVIQWLPQVTFGGSDLGALALMLGVTVLYLAVFYSLGLFISTLTHHSASALVLALFTWTLLVFILPNLGNILARQLTPLPSVAQLEQERTHIWIKEVFDRIQGKAGAEFEANINRNNNRLMEDYRTRFNRRVQLSKNLTRISPASALTFLMTDLAGTGLPEEQRVKQAVLTYKNSMFGRKTDSDGNITGETPAFTYQRRSLGDRMDGESWANLGILLLFNLLFSVSGAVFFLKYDVR